MKLKVIKRDIEAFLDYMWDSERCDYFQWERKDRSKHIFKTMARLKIALAVTPEAKEEVRRQLLTYL